MKDRDKKTSCRRGQNARKELVKEIGRPVVSKDKFLPM